MHSSFIWYSLIVSFDLSKRLRFICLITWILFVAILLKILWKLLSPHFLVWLACVFHIVKDVVILKSVYLCDRFLSSSCQKRAWQLLIAWTKITDILLLICKYWENCPICFMMLNLMWFLRVVLILGNGVSVRQGFWGFWSQILHRDLSDTLTGYM